MNAPTLLPPLPPGPFVTAAVVCRQRDPKKPTLDFLGVRNAWVLPKGGGPLDLSGFRLALWFTRGLHDPLTFPLDVRLVAPDERWRSIGGGDVTFKATEAEATANANPSWSSV